jgi:hypothetical protein
LRGSAPPITDYDHDTAKVYFRTAIRQQPEIDRALRCRRASSARKPRPSVVSFGVLVFEY